MKAKTIAYVTAGVVTLVGGIYAGCRASIKAAKTFEERSRSRLLRLSTNVEILGVRHEYPFTDVEKSWLTAVAAELLSRELEPERFMRLIELEDSLTVLLDKIIRYQYKAPDVDEKAAE